jgi:vacuolar-type H+-ATPase subunit H
MSPQTTEAARAETGAVASSAKGEAKQVARQAQDEARETLQRVQDDVRERANSEASRIAGTLHETSGRLRTMAERSDGDGLLETLLREGADATDKLGSRLERDGADGLMADVRSYARRNPGAFLLGAAAAGFVAGRVLRNASGSDGVASSHGAGSEESWQREGARAEGYSPAVGPGTTIGAGPEDGPPIPEAEQAAPGRTGELR